MRAKKRRGGAPSKNRKLADFTEQPLPLSGKRGRPRTELALPFELVQLAGDRLAFARMQHGWTQEDLAIRSGVSHRDISLYERSQRVPRLPSVVKLADALKSDDGRALSLDWLTRRSEHQYVR